MSVIYENTLVCKTCFLEEIVHKLQEFVGNSLVEHYKDDDYSLISFDTNGDLTCFEEPPLNDNDYLVYENMNEEGELESFCQGGYLIPLRISYLIKSKFIFKELADKKRQELLEDIKYWCEEEVSYEKN